MLFYITLSTKYLIMDKDLFFTVIEQQNWKEFTTTGKFKPTSVQEHGYIECIDEDDLEKYLNEISSEQDQKLLLIVIDPLRIKSTIKNITEEGVKKIRISGSLDLDSIIDKIKIGPDKKGKFRFSVKHYD